MRKNYRLIVLDRDGVINEDSVEYIKSPAEWHAIPGSLKAIAKLNKEGYKVAVVTNQSGIARGLFSEEILEKMHKKMRDELARVGGHIDALVYCPHHPNNNCECRKPKPEMLLDILKKFNTSPQDALVIGDSIKEVQMARSVGCDAILVKTGKGSQTLEQHAQDLTDVSVFENLAAVVNVITN